MFGALLTSHRPSDVGNYLLSKTHVSVNVGVAMTLICSFNESELPVERNDLSYFTLVSIYRKGLAPAI